MKTIMFTIMFIMIMVIAMIKYELSRRTAAGKFCYTAGLAIGLVPLPGTLVLVWPLIFISGFFKKK